MTLGETVRALRERTWLGILPKDALGHGRTLDGILQGRRPIIERIQTARASQSTPPGPGAEPSRSRDRPANPSPAPAIFSDFAVIGTREPVAPMMEVRSAQDRELAKAGERAVHQAAAKAFAPASYTPADRIPEPFVETERRKDAEGHWFYESFNLPRTGPESDER